MPNLLKLKRGAAASIPQGALAEPLFTSDTYDLYIGKGSGGNQRFQKYIASGTSSQFIKGDGSLDSTSYQPTITLTTTGSSGASTFVSNTLNVPNYTLSGLGGEPAITAGTTLQYWRGDKSWQTLDTNVVPENGPIYFTEPRVLATVLTGLNLTGGGTISASDSVLSAFGKVQNQISALVGGATYQGVWNASTNSPTLTSGTGTKGFYYVVSVAGSTNLDGITDWKVGDWAIFNGTTWDKVDNTDAVSSVNGFTGAVNLGLGDISNVTLTSPTNNQLIKFDGTTSKWVNFTPAYEPTLTKGNLTEATSSVLTITGGTGAVIGSGTTIEVKSASATQNGVITTGTQSIAGAKTFSSAVTSTNFVLSGGTGNTGLYYGHTDRVVLANYTAGGIDFETNGGTIYMTLFPSGNLAVKASATDAGYKLDVDGTGRFSGALSGTSATFSAGVTTGDNIVMGGGEFYYGGTSSNRFLRTYVSGTAGAGTLNYSFHSSGAGAWGIKSTLDYNGNVTFSGTGSFGGALSGTSASFSSTISASNFSGSSSGTNTGDQTTITGNAGSATVLQTARNFTINGTAKSFDGSAAVSWTAAEIGLTSYLPLSGGTLTGNLTLGNGSDIIITPATSGVNATLYNDIGKLVSTASLVVQGTGEFSGDVSGTSATFSSTSLLATGGGNAGVGVTTVITPNSRTHTFQIGSNNTGVSSELVLGHQGDGFSIYTSGGSGAGALTIAQGTTSYLSFAYGGAATFSNSVLIGSASASSSRFQLSFTNWNTTNSYPYITLTTPTGSNVAGIGINTSNDFVIGRTSGTNANFTSEDFKISNSTGAATFSSSVTASDRIRSISSSYGFMHFNNSTFDGYIDTRYISSDVGFLIETGKNGANTVPYLALGTNDTERMRITSGGKIGINDTNPNAKLSVITTDSDGISLKVGSAVVAIYSTNTSNNATILRTSNYYGNWWDIQNNPSDNSFSIDYNDSEKMRITSGGFSRFTTNGTYSSATSQHEFNQATNTQFITGFYNRGTSGALGIQIEYTGTDPNSTANQFINCQGQGTLRAEIRSNGGIANYSANDVNLSDIRVKEDIVLLDSYWNKFKQLDFVKFKYKDQTHDDYNIGLIAQQVEQIAPEFIDTDGWGITPEDGVPLKTIYTTDLYHAAMAVLKEALIRIEKLENKN